MRLIETLRSKLDHLVINLLMTKNSYIPSSYWRKYNKLEIGSGPRTRKGWLTLDYCLGSNVVWDLNKKLPFPDNCFDKVYSSHVLEHFNAKQLGALLSELYRVMTPQAEMLICVPDASKYLDAYMNRDPKNLLQYKPAIISTCRMDYLNYIFYMDGNHHHMFDAENLKWQIEQAGFVGFSLRDFDAELDSSSRDYESLYAKCYK